MSVVSSCRPLPVFNAIRSSMQATGPANRWTTLRQRSSSNGNGERTTRSSVGANLSIERAPSVIGCSSPIRRWIRPGTGTSPHETVHRRLHVEFAQRGDGGEVPRIGGDRETMSIAACSKPCWAATTPPAITQPSAGRSRARRRSRQTIRRGR